MLFLRRAKVGVPCWHSMLRVKVESEAGPFGQMPKRFHLDGRQVEIAENIERWHRAGYCYFKVKGDDGNLYILRLDEGRAEWEITSFCQERLFCPSGRADLILAAGLASASRTFTRA